MTTPQGAEPPTTPTHDSQVCALDALLESDRTGKPVKGCKHEPTDEERVQRLRELMGDDGERRITNGADIAAVFRQLDAERAALVAVRDAVAEAYWGRHMIDPYELAAVMEEPPEPGRMTAGERRVAEEAVRTVPDHIVPNKSLVAQCDRWADEIRDGAEL